MLEGHGLLAGGLNWKTKMEELREMGEQQNSKTLLSIEDCESRYLVSLPIHSAELMNSGETLIVSRKDSRDVMPK